MLGNERAWTSGVRSVRNREVALMEESRKNMAPPHEFSFIGMRISVDTNGVSSLIVSGMKVTSMFLAPAKFIMASALAIASALVAPGTMTILEAM